jgi:predicted metal-dependent hydrolase
MPDSLKYLSGYPPELVSKIQSLIEQKKLSEFIQQKYPESHQTNSDKALRKYVMQIKNQYMKNSGVLNQVQFDPRIHAVNNALGEHHFISRPHGGKLKSKNHIKISSVFKSGPEEFLNMIVVHELAHIREREHNKSFYNLCQHMLPGYHQLEFDMRVWLTQLELHEAKQPETIME